MTTVRPTATAPPTLPPATILNDVTIDHGPQELLGPLFLRTEYAIRQFGVSLSFGSLQRLAEVNANNRDSWAKLFSVYDPTYWPEDAGSNSFCLFANEPSGRSIATLAVRFYDWSTTSFYDEAVAMRAFSGNPSRPAGRRCEVSALSSHRVTGRVALAGAVWVHPDWRKHPRLMALMPRFARAYCIARWNIDYYTLVMMEGVFKGGFTKKTGMLNVDWSIDLFGSPLGDLRLALLRMDRTELHDDLSRCLVELGSEIDRGVIPHGSNQERNA